MNIVLLSWVRAEKYCEESGDPISSVTDRIHSGTWAAGEQEQLVAALLGHSTVEMVRRCYGRYIKQTGGIALRGDYSGFGAYLWHLGQHKTALNGSE